jgi:hypothetical protein
MPPEEGYSGAAQPEDGSLPDRDTAVFPPRLAEITQAAGIRFRHENGGYGEKLLPETMGSGGAFLDFDGDGKLDIFLVNSCFWPGHAPADQPPPTCHLYKGRGDGAFDDVTLVTGGGVSLYGMGAAVADYDGDQDDDIYITGVGKNVLLRNDGGVFHDASAAAGLAGGVWKDSSGHLHSEWSTGAAWADLDLDGDVDLFVSNYVEWTPSNEIFTTLDGVTKAFTTPDRYPGLPCRLYLNQGDGRFVDATLAAGLEGAQGKALGVSLWDFDGNGLLDIVVANDTRPNFFFLNRGGARFEETGLSAGIAYDETGRARAGMGIDIADYANDGVPGVAIGNFSDEPISLYRWRGPPLDYRSPAASKKPPVDPEGGFSSEAARAGLARPTFAPLTFGLLFIDLDLDGVTDLVLANGHIEPDVHRVFPSQTYPQSAQLFCGRGDGTFADMSARAGPDFLVPRVGRGLCAGDIDGDGDLDLLLTQNGGPPVLLRNDRSPSVARHFLRVRLRGKGKNTKALGAVVRLKVNGVVQTRVARTGSSYLSQCEETLTFGLGSATRAEKLTVRWPGGAEKNVAVEGVDRTIEIVEDP